MDFHFEDSAVDRHRWRVLQSHSFGESLEYVFFFSDSNMRAPRDFYGESDADDWFRYYNYFCSRFPISEADKGDWVIGCNNGYLESSIQAARVQFSWDDFAENFFRRFGGKETKGNHEISSQLAAPVEKKENRELNQQLDSSDFSATTHLPTFQALILKFCAAGDVVHKGLDSSKDISSLEVSFKLQVRNLEGRDYANNCSWHFISKQQQMEVFTTVCVKQLKWCISGCLKTHVEQLLGQLSATRSLSEICTEHMDGSNSLGWNGNEKCQRLST